MELGTVQIAVGLHLDLVQGIISKLYVDETIPHEIAFGSISATIEEPIVEVRHTGDTPRLGLKVTGVFSTDTDNTPFQLWLVLQPFVRTVSGQVPVAALNAQSVEEATPANIGPLVGGIALAQINDILTAMDIPIYNSLIAGIESAFFGDTPPNRSTWNADFYLGKTSSIDKIEVGFPRGQPDQPHVRSSIALDTAPALIATLALPGESATLPDNPSIVPIGTGIQILIARSAMDAVLAAQAAERVGQTMEGATINALSMRMHDLGIEISGNADKSGATISWGGILLLFFRKYYFVKGSRRWHDGYVNVFTSGIDVAVNTPWYVKVLQAFLFFLGPVGWILNSTLIEPQLKEGEEAPNIVRGAFRNQVSDALENMIGNVGGFSTDSIPFMDFGKDAWVLEGHYTHSLLAFAGLHRDTLGSVTHDRFELEGAQGQSVDLITTGKDYVLHPEEMGRLLKAGIVDIPNLHGVEAPYGFYARTDPNDTPDDNLVDPTQITTG